MVKKFFLKGFVCYRLLLSVGVLFWVLSKWSGWVVSIIVIMVKWCWMIGMSNLVVLMLFILVLLVGWILFWIIFCCGVCCWNFVVNLISMLICVWFVFFLVFFVCWWENSLVILIFMWLGKILKVNIFCLVVEWMKV